MHDLFASSPDAALAAALDAEGHAPLPRLLTADQCRQLASQYGNASLYRSTVVMARHGFGRGEYKCVACPLPPPLESLRHTLYPRRAPIAKRWNAQLGIDVRYPDTLTEFLDRCHRTGQRRPTPPILSYREGDHNGSRTTHRRADVVPLAQGDAVVFTVHQRPERGPGGRTRRLDMRHSVSRVHSGRRHTVGLIFHDAL